MEIGLSVEGLEPVDGLQELADWLAQDDELRGQVAAAAAIPGAGDLGAASDTLLAAVGSGGAISVLAASLKGFLSQPRRSDVKIVLTGVDGRRVEIDAKRVDDVEALVRRACGEAE